MYHICPPQCQIQLARRKEIDAHDSVRLRAEFRAQGVDPLGRSVGRPVTGLNQRCDAASLDRRVDFERAGDDQACLVGDRQRLQRVTLEERVDRLGQRRGRRRLGAKRA